MKLQTKNNRYIVEEIILGKLSKSDKATLKTALAFFVVTLIAAFFESRVRHFLIMMLLIFVVVSTSIWLLDSYLLLRKYLSFRAIYVVESVLYLGSVFLLGSVLEIKYLLIALLAGSVTFLFVGAVLSDYTMSRLMILVT